VRSTLLWHTALQRMPKRGHGYTAQSSTAQALTVSSQRLHDYQAQHTDFASEPKVRVKAKTPTPQSAPVMLGTRDQQRPRFDDALLRGGDLNPPPHFDDEFC
jgi:intracellular multiplication protein IcmO